MLTNAVQCMLSLSSLTENIKLIFQDCVICGNVSVEATYALKQPKYIKLTSSAAIFGFGHFGHDEWKPLSQGSICSQTLVKILLCKI